MLVGGGSVRMGRLEEVNVLRCASGLCLAHDGNSWALPLLDGKEIVLGRMNADVGGTWMSLILLLDLAETKD
jgi:hypothetical protein